MADNEPIDTFSVMFTSPKPGEEGPTKWFETLNEAKEALGDRPGIIWKNDLRAAGTGENVYQQS